MARMLALAGMVLVLAACDNAQVKTTLDTSKLTYSRDARTNLCYATVGRGESAIGMRAASLSFTHVPCTAEVLARIQQGG